MNSLSLRKPLSLDDLKGANGPAPAWDLIMSSVRELHHHRLLGISDRVPFSHCVSQVAELEIVEGVMAGRVRARATSLKSLSPPACSRREGS